MINEENAKKARAVQSLIAKGRLDHWLDDINTAIIQRRLRLARLQFEALKIGDEVRVSSHVKPKYMAGAVGKVVEKRQTKVTVEFDEPMGRFGRRVIVPLSALEVVV